MKLPNVTHTFKWAMSNWRKLSFKKVYSWAMAYVRMNKADNQPTITPSDGPNPVFWETEQAQWRMERVGKISPKCLEGACIHCGCDTPDKFWEEDSCEFGCYPTWLSEEQWKKRKNVTEA